MYNNDNFMIHNIKQTKLYYKSFMINDDDGRLVIPKEEPHNEKEKKNYLYNNS